jgi:hypothetical protein
MIIEISGSVWSAVGWRPVDTEDTCKQVVYKTGYPAYVVNPPAYVSSAVNYAQNLVNPGANGAVWYTVTGTAREQHADK